MTITYPAFLPLQVHDFHGCEQCLEHPDLPPLHRLLDLRPGGEARIQQADTLVLCQGPNQKVFHHAGTLDHI